jgi:hypothetical protein
MRRTTRLDTLARRANPRARATHRTGSSPQDKAHLGASGPAAPATPALIGRDLHNQRMGYASGRPRDVTRGERRRTKQTDDEREW